MVEGWLLEWLNLGLRWFHLVAAIGWIGSSLYFMWLDASLTRPAPARRRVEGEVWMVHSGGFYLVERRRPGPGELPPVLHWFRWEAALTGASGFGLLVVVYYLSGGVHLVDPARPALAPGAAAALGIGVVAGGWLVYDALWISRLARGRGWPALAVSGLLLLAAVYGLSRLLAGRGAYIHVGAMLGTIMVANVWMRIVPAQRELIRATAEGREPDWSLSARAKTRSVHNSYLTFPVLFTMLSSHFPSTYGHRLGWLVLGLMFVVGATVRHAMIAREHRRPADWVLLPAAAALAAALYLTAPAPRAGGPAVPFAAVQRVVDLRCRSCHSTRPTDDVFRTAPGGVTFDAPESIRAHADAIRLRSVEARTMPPGNKTGMTDEERALLDRWVAAGAPLDGSGR